MSMMRASARKKRPAGDLTLENSLLMTMRETILGLIAGIACILALLALQYAGMARKSRDTYKERYDSVKGLLWYVPDEQWETYVNQRLKKLGNEPYKPNDGDDPIYARPASASPPGPWRSASPPSH
jgi:hypothetical protein